MKQIQIGFSRASTSMPIFSWIIMAVQKTNYSHVYLKFYDDEIQRWVYYQASHTMVNYMGEETFLGQETVVKEFTFTVPDAALMAWKQFAIDNAGKPYGIKEVLGLAICEVAMIFGMRMNNPFKDAGTTWICDQLIAEGLRVCDKIVLPMPLDDMIPSDVFKLIENLPATLD